MTKRDYYEILGVNKNSTADEVKKAYRKKAMQYHPDKNPGDKKSEANFKDAAEAYDVLKDDQKKAAYDQYGHAAFENGMGGGGHGGGFSHAHFNDFSDIFSAFGDVFGGQGFNGGMGNGRGRRQKSSAIDGSDLRYNLEISLEEAYSDKAEKIDFRTTVKCDSCNGTGAEKGSKSQTCPNCNGSGTQRRQQGFFIMETTCNKCGGSGEVIKNPCHSCGGDGKKEKSKTLSIKIPAGIEDGNRIRLSGEGEAGTRGGHPGDLYVFISVKHHKLFIRQNNDIHCQVPLLITTAALGGSLDIPTIEGTKASLKIPTGTQTGSKFRLKGKGMPIINSGGRQGDMIVEVKIETPEHLSQKEKDLLNKLDEILKEKQKNSSNSFFKKWFS